MDLLITHANCNDGYHAHLVVKLAFPKIETIFASYRDNLDLERVRDKDVLMVDFSFGREKLLEIKAAAKSLKVIDHHESAMNEVGDLDFCHFDMNHSGAMLAWMRLFPGEDPPRILSYVEDRDLWRFKLPDSKAISALMTNLTNKEINKIFKQNMEIVDAHRMQTSLVENHQIATDAETHLIKMLAQDGNLILRVVNENVRRTCLSHNKIKIGDNFISIVNASENTSEVGNYLCEQKRGGKFECNFAMIWCVSSSGKVMMSLRSNRDNPDATNVAEFASQYGGGGHKHAAGFGTTLDQVKLWLHENAL